MAVDNHIKQMIQELGHALVQAIAGSPEAAEAIGRIRQEGYSLHLVLDREEAGGREARIELTNRQPSPREATFVLDKGDVSLLKTLGIDATRSRKRR